MCSHCFYCVHWVSYVTGTLYFGKFDVTEMQFSAMGVFAVTALFGQEFWELNFLCGFPLRYCLDSKAMTVCMYIVMFQGIWRMFRWFCRFWQVGRSRLSWRQQMELEWMEQLLQILQLFLHLDPLQPLLSSGFTWLTARGSTLGINTTSAWSNNSCLNC